MEPAFNNQYIDQYNDLKQTLLNTLKSEKLKQNKLQALQANINKQLHDANERQTTVYKYCESNKIKLSNLTPMQYTRQLSSLTMQNLQNQLNELYMIEENHKKHQTLNNDANKLFQETNLKIDFIESEMQKRELSFMEGLVTQAKSIQSLNFVHTSDKLSGTQICDISNVISAIPEFNVTDDIVYAKNEQNLQLANCIKDIVKPITKKVIKEIQKHDQDITKKDWSTLSDDEIAHIARQIASADGRVNQVYVERLFNTLVEIFSASNDIEFIDYVGTESDEEENKKIPEPKNKMKKQKEDCKIF